MGRIEAPPPLDGNRQASMLNNVIASTTLAIVTTIARLITRIWVVRQVGWDDYTIVAATLGHIFGIILVPVEMHYGFGRPGAAVPESYLREFGKYSYAEWIQTFQTLMFTKLSICFFLLRIHVDKRYTRPIQGAIAFLIVSNVILTLLWIFQCSPVDAAWDKRKLDSTKKNTYCMTNAQLERIIISQAIISIISDVVLALFPILLLWKVQISLRSKVGLCSLMGLGLATATLCIIRTVFNWQNVNDDPTWESDMNLFFRTWEVGVGIMAACIPALRPGYKALKTRVSTYYSSQKSPSYSGGSKSRSGSSKRPNKLETDSYGDALMGLARSGSAGELMEMKNMAQELTRPSAAAVTYQAEVYGAAHDKDVDDDGVVEAGIRNKEVDGIKKTMIFGTDSDGNLGGKYTQKGEHGRGFV